MCVCVCVCVCVFCVCVCVCVLSLLGESSCDERKKGIVVKYECITGNYDESGVTVFSVVSHCLNLSIVCQ